ncbi:uncharacterized protein LOC143292059 isoform X2 [Babylonia areolata]|uniref:uncharacterized protein LOC143292059 isoform X2 n=1 Tax=Babylonia areolata TaxID=304850 RepID=UPI003FD1EFD3
MEGGRSDSAGRADQGYPMAGVPPQQDPEQDLLGLSVVFQQPSTSQSAHFKPQKSRPKGRKAEKPVKLSKRRVNGGDEEGREEAYQDNPPSLAQNEAMDNSEEGSSVIKNIKWDISSRDFSKEQRKQTMPGAGPKEEDPSQPSFTCITCHQAFNQAADYMSHVCATDQSPPSVDMEQEDLLPNGLVGTSGSDKDMYEDVVVDDSLKYRRVVGDKVIYHCPVCEAVFTDLFQFNLHREEAHPEQDAMKRFECQACKKTFLGRRVLNQHYRRNHPEEKFYPCPVCGQSFPTASSLCLHKRNHVGHRPFKCDDEGCDRAFPDVASLNRHKRTHCKERPHVCQHCGKAFKMQNHLREHTRLHTGEKPFVCEVCGAGFAQSNGLKSHARQHMLDRKNQCNICHKIFSHPQFLELHKKNHSEEKPFSCEVCGQKFRTTTNLGAHKRLKHDIVNRKGTNVYTCDVCGSTFSQACNLAVHKKIHGGEKPFTCDLCDQTFRTPANLGAHRKLKHEMDNQRVEKHFTCDICGASFSQACNLGIHKKKKHIDSPSLERNYVCDICDARFSEPCNLGAHKKIKHAEESDDGRPVFECDICAAKFYRACNLSGHRRRKHGDTGDMKEADKPFLCQFCHLRCTSLENLQEHKTKIHFSMPTCFTDKKNSIGVMSKSQQQTTLPSNSSAFDSQQHHSVSDSSSLEVQQSKFHQSFPKSNHSMAFPTTVPPVSDSEELSHHDSFIDQSESGAITTETKYNNSNSRAFITPGGDVQHKLTFDHTVGAFDSGLPNTATPTMHSFPLGVRPPACHVCGALMPNERTLLQHLQMHSNERYLHDVFSAQ